MYNQRPTRPFYTFAIIGINFIVYFITMYDPTHLLMRMMSLVPNDIFFHFRLWELLTHFFVHGSISHIVFNMLMLFFIGPILEQIWGGKRFITFYLLSGLITGILAAVIYAVLGQGAIQMIGASGALYSLMVGVAVTIPDASFLLFFILPVKARYMPFVFLGIDLLFAFLTPGDQVAHWAHLAGLGVGYLLYLFMLRPSFGARRVPPSGMRFEEIRERKSKSTQDKAFFVKMCLYKLKNNIAFSEKEKEMLADYARDDKRSVIALCNENDFDLEAAGCEKCERILHCILREIRRREG